MTEALSLLVGLLVILVVLRFMLAGLVPGVATPIDLGLSALRARPDPSGSTFGVGVLGGMAVIEFVERFDLPFFDYQAFFYGFCAGVLVALRATAWVAEVVLGLLAGALAILQWLDLISVSIADEGMFGFNSIHGMLVFLVFGLMWAVYGIHLSGSSITSVPRAGLALFALIQLWVFITSPAGVSLLDLDALSASYVIVIGLVLAAILGGFCVPFVLGVAGICVAVTTFISGSAQGTGGASGLAILFTVIFVVGYMVGAGLARRLTPRAIQR